MLAAFYSFLTFLPLIPPPSPLSPPSPPARCQVEALPLLSFMIEDILLPSADLKPLALENKVRLALLFL